MARQVANNLEQLYLVTETLLDLQSLNPEWPGGGSSSLYRKDAFYGFVQRIALTKRRVVTS